MLQYDIFSDMTVQGALKDKSIETNEDALLHLKYDPESVFAYIEVWGPSFI